MNGRPGRAAAVAVAVTAATACLWHWTPFTWATAAVAVVMWAAADFTSGLYHMLLDYLPPGQTWLRRQAVAFQVHHYMPGAFLLEGRLATSTPTGIAALAVMLLAAFLPPLERAGLTVYALGIYLTQLSHGYAHRPVLWVRPLQALHIFLPVHAHQKHHIDTGGSYCVLCGWCNPLLDRIAGARG